MKPASPWSNPRDVTLNGKSVGYRRDLQGSDLIYEFKLLIGKIQPGDTLCIPLALLRNISPPLGSNCWAFGPFDHPTTFWLDEARDELRFTRTS